MRGWRVGGRGCRGWSGGRGVDAARSLLVRRVVVRVQRDEPQVVALAKPDRSHLLRDAERVERLPVRRGATDLFPLQAWRSVDVDPGHLAETVQDLDHLSESRPFEREELRLELA